MKKKLIPNLTNIVLKVIALTYSSKGDMLQVDYLLPFSKHLEVDVVK